MRELTSRQKQFLDKLEEVYTKEGIELRTVADIKDAHYETLKGFNDTEILWQEVNRYLSDKAFENVNQ